MSFVPFLVSVGAFEHFCSVEEYLAGKQDAIYDHFFRLCHDLLPPGGRLYLQTMMLGRNAPAIENFSLEAPKGSNEYIAAIGMEFFPGSWLPFGEEHILRVAAPYFEQISHNNGRLDYIHTIKVARDKQGFLRFMVKYQAYLYLPLELLDGPLS